MIKVILAEDTPVLRRHLVDLIDRQDDMKVVGFADTGAEIFDIAKRTDFDIAVLDIDMETSTAGIIAAGEILSVKPSSKIVFLSVHEDDEMILCALEAGNVDYVVKSDDLENVLRHIRSFADGKPVLDTKVGSAMKREFLRLRKTENNLLYFIKNLSGLTSAEKQLVRLLLQGYSARQIAEERVVELSTVKTQISHILKKVNAKRSKELVDNIREKNLEQLLMD